MEPRDISMVERRMRSGTMVLRNYYLTCNLSETGLPRLAPAEVCVVR